MKITHFIMPRCSGKTTEIEKRISSSKGNSFLINKYNFSNFGFKFEYIDEIYIDDFIYNYNNCLNKNKFISDLNYLFNYLRYEGKIYLYSTSDKLYSKELLLNATLYDKEIVSKIKEKIKDPEVIYEIEKREILYQDIQNKFITFNSNVIKKQGFLKDLSYSNSIFTSGIETYLVETKGEYILTEKLN